MAEQKLGFKTFCPEKNFDQNFFWSKKCLLKKLGKKKIIGKKISVKKKKSEKEFGSKKFLAPKKFGSKKCWPS